MTALVLVHGGSQGAWCWERLVPLLQASAKVSHAIALDLPGHGARAREQHKGITLADYADAVRQAIEAHALRDVVLVGHSLGGITVIAAAPLVARRLKRIVFLGGMAPEEGKSAADMLARQYAPGPSERERIAAAGQRQVFCSDMDDAEAAAFLARITPEPRLPLETPVYVSRLPKDMPVTYIVQALDRSLSPAFQRRLLRNLRDPEVLEIAGGRNSMWTRPKELAALLLRHA
jgi:pimeloyl-ACP methyl ester carboxylesterase